MCGALLARGCFAEDQQSLCRCSEAGIGTLHSSLQLPRPWIPRTTCSTVGMGVHYKNFIKESHFFSWSLYSFLLSDTQENDFRGIFPNPLLLSSPPPAAFSGLPQERELKTNAFSFSSSTSLCCLKCTLWRSGEFTRILHSLQFFEKATSDQG